MTGGDISQRRRGEQQAPQTLRQTMAQAAAQQRERQGRENWHAALAAQRAQEEAERALWSNWWQKKK
jgi:hypothetical protein